MTIEFVKSPVPANTPPTPDTPPAAYSENDLLEIIEWDLGDIEQLIAEALTGEYSVGACSSCGNVVDDVYMETKDDFCDNCGDFAVSSVCVLAGVV